MFQDEILRVVDSLQLVDKHRIATPVDWKQGDDVIIHVSVSNEEAKTLFPDHKQHYVSNYKTPTWEVTLTRMYSRT